MNPSLEMIRVVAQRLGESLRKEVVFLGGAVVGLLITDSGAPEPRPTDDVDLIIELASPAQYWLLSDRLRARGFQEDTSDGAPLCRWLVGGVKVDVMPDHECVLGFTNRWYTAALRCAETVVLEGCLPIRVVPAPHFLATKIEAFKSRGANDFIMSHDLEDVVAVVDGNERLLDEAARADRPLREYLAFEFSQLLSSDDFMQALPGFLPSDEASQARLSLVSERLRGLASMTSDPKPTEA